MATSFMSLAHGYLLRGIAEPTDEQLTRASMFGLWMQETYVDVSNVIDLQEASQRWLRDGGENWRDEGSPFMVAKFGREDREADRRSGIFWQPGARKLATAGGA